ncbi:MAG: PSD1 and planctomycete cytochrome C domain-containing protein [Roseibacillus sp.]|jgi:hypothetical protein|nr:PSD1 and planctomycete cytochrome C domain-containing protein [Roseibacillus sp.]
MNLRAISFFLVFSASLGLAQDERELTTEELKFFESKIRPIFAEYCYKCHSAEEKIKGGLQLDNRAGLRHGGDSGVVLVPGKPAESLLVTAITWADEDYEMPPKQKLPASAIANIKKWIEMGAPDPRGSEKVVLENSIDIEEGRKFWSFQKPRRPALPEVKDEQWVKSEIDFFVMSRLETAGLTPAQDASPELLLRRLYFDLIGLPPTVPELEAYGAALRIDSDAAYRAKVDELLARPQFGERWGRHWLDVARYAESSGKEVNMTFPHAWRYRDYVIDSFNQDKPYNRFVQEQIAGDLLKIKSDEEWQENLIATGFLAIGTKGLNERNPRQFAIDLADEQIDSTTQAILGLTVSCARCHDHKFDPIPTIDYYALSGIFQSTRTYFGTVNVIVNRRGTKLLELPVPDATPMKILTTRELEAIKSRLANSEDEMAELLANRRSRQQGQNNNNQQQLNRLRTTVAQLRARLNGHDANGVAKTLAMGVQDYANPVDPTVLVRGEIDKPAQTVSRGFLQVLHHPEVPMSLPRESSGRLELARWLTSEENPLTARVMVNRIWQKLFGKGIVTSSNNFGTTGQAPTHPGLLDHLAVHFMKEGWSTKGMIRELVNSRSYRMSSTYSKAAYTKDPDNALHWRSTPRRLDAEALRDAMLVASGDLDLERPRGSMVVQVGDVGIGPRVNAAVFNRPVKYRSVYLPIVRDGLPESLALFDPADPNLVTGDRESTNVPGQALYMMNNPFVVGQGVVMARRLIEEAETSGERLTLAFQLTYGRLPSSSEIEQAKSFLWNFISVAQRKGRGREEAGILALSSFCQGLLCSAEFRYLN